MGGTTLHADILVRWFEKLILLLYFFKKVYATLVVSGILFGLMQL